MMAVVAYSLCDACFEIDGTGCRLLVATAEPDLPIAFEVATGAGGGEAAGVRRTP